MIETPEAVENAQGIAAVEGIGTVHIGSADLSTEMGVGGAREALEFQIRLLHLGVRYLTGGSDTGYVLGADRADVKRLRELKQEQPARRDGTPLPTQPAIEPRGL